MAIRSPLEMNDVPDMASTYLKYEHGGNYGVWFLKREYGGCVFP